MLVHRRIIPSIKFASTNLYTWVEGDTVRVSVLLKNTTQCSRPARTRTQTAWSRVSTLTMRPPRNWPTQKALVVVWDKNISWSFGHPNTAHVENKSYRKITKLGQKGSFKIIPPLQYDRLKTHGSLCSIFRNPNMLVCTSICRIPQYFYSRHLRHNYVTRRYIRQHLQRKE